MALSLEAIFLELTSSHKEPVPEAVKEAPAETSGAAHAEDESK
jgi:hypothetical protein